MNARHAGHAAPRDPGQPDQQPDTPRPTHPDPAAPAQPGPRIRRTSAQRSPPRAPFLAKLPGGDSTQRLTIGLNHQPTPPDTNAGPARQRPRPERCHVRTQPTGRDMRPGRTLPGKLEVLRQLVSRLSAWSASSAAAPAGLRADARGRRDDGAPPGCRGELRRQDQPGRTGLTQGTHSGGHGTGRGRMAVRPWLSCFLPGADGGSGENQSVEQVTGGQDEPLAAAPLLAAAETENRGGHGLESEPPPEPTGCPRSTAGSGLPPGRRPSTAPPPVSTAQCWTSTAASRPHSGQETRRSLLGDGLAEASPRPRKSPRRRSWKCGGWPSATTPARAARRDGR
jgi:hypothetical protein